MDFANSGQGQCGKTAGKNPFLFLTPHPIKMKDPSVAGGIADFPDNVSDFSIRSLCYPEVPLPFGSSHPPPLRPSDFQRFLANGAPPEQTEWRLRKRLCARVDSRTGLDLNRFSYSLRPEAAAGFGLGAWISAGVGGLDLSGGGLGHPIGRQPRVRRVYSIDAPVSRGREPRRRALLPRS